MFVCCAVGPEGVARGADALSILETSESRSQFIDELMEVKASHMLRLLCISRYKTPVW